MSGAVRNRLYRDRRRKRQEGLEDLVQILWQELDDGGRSRVVGYLLDAPLELGFRDLLDVLRAVLDGEARSQLDGVLSRDKNKAK